MVPASGDTCSIAPCSVTPQIYSSQPATSLALESFVSVEDPAMPSDLCEEQK
ncbi:rCG54646 [Rattus norvegicus]|uniref:RCG54646 n=1 Tax=Rattus norvegicus TaxID=10116 RepID=A6JAF7_RAT|nr:rCG54646 [Rattus norvegicus]